MYNRSSLLPACALAVLATFLGGLGLTAMSAVAQQEAAAGPAVGKWKIYRDDRYAFHLSYPPDSQVQTGRDRGYQYLRVHNYEPEPGSQGSMQPGEYHLEMLIFDHRLGHRMPSPCRDLVREPRQVRAGRVNALRGLAER